MSNYSATAYWEKNIQYLAMLLPVWFLVLCGYGTLFVDELSAIRPVGFKLGFGFAQQGSIYVLVMLIFVYVYLMNELNKEYGADEE